MTRSRASEEQGPGRETGWALAVLAAAEVALVGWWGTTQAALLFVLGQALLVALLALVLLGDRYLRFRRAFERDIARRAVQQQRRELAEDMHDVLGHELSLIAIRAGALQVTTTGRAAERAAEVRGQVEQAVLQLRQTVELLRSADPSPASLEPPASDVDALVARAREAGADITTSGQVGPSVPAHVRLVAHRLVQECLTNAAKHAPGSPVTVTIHEQDAVLQVAVETEGAGDGAGAAESGLRILRRRIDAIGGALQARVVAGRHVTQAWIPLSTAPVRTGALAADLQGNVPAQQRPGAATLRWALVRVAAFVVVTVSFYGWATHDATLEQDVFDDLREGEAVAQARSVLPDRQAPVRLSAVPPAPAAWRCTSYTDGNFPLGMATFEICDDGTRLTRVSDLREVAWT